MTEKEAIEFFKGCKHHCDNTEFHDMAIKALKKQIPVKPKPLKERTWDGQIVYDCSVCGGRLGTKQFAKEQGHIGCSRCLQLIDWKGVE